MPFSAQSRRLFVLAVLALGAAANPPEPLPAAVPAYESGKTDCAIRAMGMENPYRIASFFVLPGERVTLSVSPRHRDSEHTLKVAEGELTVEPGKWIWRAPAKPGLYKAELFHAHSGAVTEVNFFVLVPFREARSGSLNGYQIGRYPGGSGRSGIVLPNPSRLRRGDPGSGEDADFPAFQTGAVPLQAGIGVSEVHHHRTANAGRTGTDTRPGEPAWIRSIDAVCHERVPDARLQPFPGERGQQPSCVRRRGRHFRRQQPGRRG